MKKKKNTEPQENIFLQTPLERRIKSHQAFLQKEENKKIEKDNALFRKRINESTNKKAPKTLRTKSYYRFSKEFPTETDQFGFRENATEIKSFSKIKMVIFFFLLLFVFVFSVLISQIALGFAEKETKYNNITPQDVKSVISALHFTHEELSILSSEELINKLKILGCNTAVLEFKDETGNVYYDVKTAAASSTDKKTTKALEKTKALQDNGYKCAAYISCFKDNMTETSLADAKLKTKSGEIFKDSNNFSWFNPFDDKANKYLLDLIKEADEFGFDYIILDNVCYPSKFTEFEPNYNIDKLSADIKNKKLCEFINSAISIIGTEKVIVMCDISGIAAIFDGPDEKYSGSLVNSQSLVYAVDVRYSKIDVNLMENSRYFSFVEEMPSVFMLDACSLAKSCIAQSKEGFSIFAVTDKTTTDQLDFVRKAGIDNLIIW